MKTMPGGERIVAGYGLFEYMETNQKFNSFIGQCITHFVHFVVPRRDQTQEITQDYPVPTDIEDVGGDRVLLTRKDNGNVIFIDWWR